MNLLRTVFIVQLVLMVPTCAFLSATPGNLYGALLVFYLVPVGLACAIYAVWQIIRYPARRRLAMATASTPFVCLGLPVGIHWLNDGPVEPGVVVAVAVMLVVIAALVRLGRTG